MAKKTKPSETSTGTKATAKTVTISPPNFKYTTLKIVGTSPYVQNRMSEKAMQMMHKTQAEGSTAKGKKKRDPKDFKLACEDAKHVSEEGWCGIPAPAFRNAIISACKIVGFEMTRAKLAIFCEADGFDVVDGTPLVKITKGKPVYSEHAVKNASGVIDLRPRPMWKPGWEAMVTLKFDADMFTLDDVTNLMHRVGEQVGVGEGRHDSRKSSGMGWGTFSLERDSKKQSKVA